MPDVPRHRLVRRRRQMTIVREGIVLNLAEDVRHVDERRTLRRGNLLQLGGHEGARPILELSVVDRLGLVDFRRQSLLKVRQHLALFEQEIRLQCKDWNDALVV